jgi:HlyD family secretion protein
MLKIILSVVITLVVVFVLLAGVGFWFSRNAASLAVATPVRVETVRKGELVELVQAPGEVQPREKVSISARTAARIIDIPVIEGRVVKKDDVLIRLDASDLQASMRSTEARAAAQRAGIQVADSRVAAQQAQLEGQRATLAEAELDLKRQKELLGTRDVSQSIVDTAEHRVQEQRASFESSTFSLQAEKTNLEVLKHNLDAADAEISRAREELKYTVITSPLDGVVTLINAKVGELVVTGTMNNAGTVIMEVADLSQMLVLARVDETDVARVKVGQNANVHVQAYPHRVFTGKVTSVALTRTVDRNSNLGSGDTKIFKVEILLDTQGERIYSGLTADVEIEAKTHADILRVPSQAVLGAPTDELPLEMRTNNPNVDLSKTLATVVYRFLNGKAVVTPVAIGASDISYTIITGGLSDGDRIITGPYKVLEQLHTDQPVREETAPTSQPANSTAEAK